MTLLQSLATSAVLAAPAACTGTAPPAAPMAPSVAAVHDSVCAVWNRELSFAKSVVEHDDAAFAEHILEGAAFVGSGGTLVGRDAIVKGWAGLLHAENMRFDWHPLEVVVTSDPHVAMSRGPVWIEVMKPGGPKKFQIGAYQSTWVLDKDGVWRVAIDGGQDTKEVSEAEFLSSKASVPPVCPAAPAPKAR